MATNRGEGRFGKKKQVQIGQSEVVDSSSREVVEVAKKATAA